MLDVWLKGNISPSAELFYEDLDEADNIEVIRKLLDTLKASLMEENQMELALRTSEALLQFNPEDRSWLAKQSAAIFPRKMFTTNWSVSLVWRRKKSASFCL